MKRPHLLKLAALLTLLTAISAECYGKQPYSTQYNLDFEYAKTDSVPAQWTAKNFTMTGYSAHLDREVKQHGRSSLRVRRDTVGMVDQGRFVITLPGELVAGKKLAVSGWIKTEGLSENGYANLGFLEKAESGKFRMQIDTLDAIRGTSNWTRFTTTRTIGDSVAFVNLSGIVMKGGTAWFDNIEIRIDGKLYKDRIIPALKTELTDKDKRDLRKYVYPLRTCEPDGGNTRDLDLLKQLIGNSRVVGLGECTHGTSEIYKMKDRIIRYLARNDGFNIFALEADMSTCHKINDYTATGIGDPRQAIQGLYIWPWWTEEMLTLVEWMRTYNTPAPKITFTGMDLQYPTFIMPELLKLLENCPTAAQSAAELSDKVQRIFFQPFDKALAKEIGIGLDELTTNEELSFLPAERKVWVGQYIDMLHRFLTKSEVLDWRDRGMAANVEWIMGQHPGSKILLWAHDLHIGQNGNWPMGIFLKERLGDDYRTFGFACYEGQYTAWQGGLKSFELPSPAPGTVEYVLGQLDEPIFILDIKKMREQKAPALRWLGDLEYREIGASFDILCQSHIPDTFDYLIFIRNTSASHLLKFETN